jgi:hypothetical protein
MAETDFTYLTDSLSSPVVARGVTAGVTPPNGGGSYVFGLNSLDLNVGAVALKANQVGDYNPLLAGGTVRGALQRGVSGGRTNFAPYLFIGLTGNTVNDQGYVLGLGDSDPHHIILKKGAINNGLLDAAPDAPNNGVLMRSTAAYAPGTWLHLRLDMIVQGSGDVLLQVYANDLTAHAVTTPTWVTVPGMEGPQYPSITGFIDDALAVNTGSAPFVSGYAGFGFYTADVTRRAYFDHFQLGKQ